MENIPVQRRDGGIIQVINELQSMGVAIELDGFGLGQFFIEPVTKLRVNRIKIDGSFVAAAPTAPKSR